MEQGGDLIPSLFTLRRIAYSIKEDRNDMATWNSRGLRGSTLEDMINKTNEKYRENGLALIQKIPTPITPIKMEPETRHIHWLISSRRVRLTILALYRESRYALMQKNVIPTRFPLANIHEHQVEFMRCFEKIRMVLHLSLYRTHTGTNTIISHLKS